MDKIKNLKVERRIDKFLEKFFFFAGLILFVGWIFAVYKLSYPKCEGLNFIFLGLCFILLSKWFKKDSLIKNLESNIPPIKNV